MHHRHRTQRAQHLTRRGLHDEHHRDAINRACLEVERTIVNMR